MISDEVYMGSVRSTVTFIGDPYSSVWDPYTERRRFKKILSVV